MNVKKEIILQGLNCANCAAKIESKVSKLSGIESASLNFVSKTLSIIIKEGEDSKAIINKIIDIINSTEPGLNIIINNNDDHGADDKKHELYEDESKKELLLLVIASILYATTIIFKFSDAAKLIIYLICYIMVGAEVVINAVKNIFKGQVFDENFLMTIATVGAFAIKQYPEAVAVMLFYQIGEFIQNRAVNRSRKSIGELMNIRPDYANLISNNEVNRVSPQVVKIGDVIEVRPGEKVPLDGIVIEGSSTVNTSALTGESIPREIFPGSEALSGFINNNGLLKIKVTKEFSESTVTKILDLVQNASSRKAPTENFVTKFARIYTPVVVFIAAFLAIVPPIILQDSSFSQWFYRALIFLVISCPCALVISIPLGFFGGIGAASKKGILVKGSNYLEALNSVDTVVFDKTGTLTKGVFKVTDIEAQNEISKDELLEYGAYAESYSDHPISASILKEYKKNIDKSKINNYVELPGYGVSVEYKGKKVLAGNAKLMEREGISINNKELSGTVVHIALDSSYAGYILISDEVKEDSFNAIRVLKKMGIKTVMLTGDVEAIGSKVAESLGLDEYYCGLLPQNKVQKLEELKAKEGKNKKIAFVGDGINDAPSLAIADVGIAMGGLGRDAAIEASDVVIMDDSISKIDTGIKIGKRTRKIVWQNIIFSLGVKFVILSLGAFGMATIWEAVFADVGVTLIAVINSMRTMRS